MTLEVVDGAPVRDDTQAAFYFDFASPECYLVAERLLGLLPVPCEWRPVIAADLPGGLPEISREMVELRAAQRGLQAVRWPDPTPFDSGVSMRAAAFAMGAGKTVAFSLAAFRQAYAGGRVLDEDTVLLAGAACEIHPRALLAGLDLRATAAALARCSAAATAQGVQTVPAIWTGAEVVYGDDGLQRAAALLGGG